MRKVLNSFTNWMVKVGAKLLLSVTTTIKSLLHLRNVLALVVYILGFNSLMLFLPN